MKKILAVLVLCCICLTAVVPAYAQGITSFLDGIQVKDNAGKTVIDDNGWKGTAQMDVPALFMKYKNLAAFITAILTATSLFSLFFFISKLATTLDNDFSRKKAIAGIATSAIGVALMGSLTFVIAFFYKFLQ